MGRRSRRALCPHTTPLAYGGRRRRLGSRWHFDICAACGEEFSWPNCSAAVVGSRWHWGTGFGRAADRCRRPRASTTRAPSSNARARIRSVARLASYQPRDPAARPSPFSARSPAAASRADRPSLARVARAVPPQREHGVDDRSLHALHGLSCCVRARTLARTRVCRCCSFIFLARTSCQRLDPFLVVESRRTRAIPASRASGRGCRAPSGRRADRPRATATAGPRIVFKLGR